MFGISEEEVVYTDLRQLLIVWDFWRSSTHLRDHFVVVGCFCFFFGKGEYITPRGKIMDMFTRKGEENGHTCLHFGDANVAPILWIAVVTIN